VIKADNQRLREELKEYSNAKQAALLASEQPIKVQKKQPKKDSRVIPGISAHHNLNPFYYENS